MFSCCGSPLSNSNFLSNRVSSLASSLLPSVFLWTIQFLRTHLTAWFFFNRKMVEMRIRNRNSMAPFRVSAALNVLTFNHTAPQSPTLLKPKTVLSPEFWFSNVVVRLERCLVGKGTCCHAWPIPRTHIVKGGPFCTLSSDLHDTHMHTSTHTPSQCNKNQS